MKCIGVAHLRLAALLLLIMVAAPVSSAAGPVLFFGGLIGKPIRVAANAAILIPIGPQPAPAQDSIGWRGLVVDFSRGDGGGRLAAGVGVFGAEAALMCVGLDATATYTRTSGRTRGATPHASYAGVSAGMTFSLVRATLGVETRVSGPAPGRRTLFTWSFGMRVPLWF